MTNMKMEYKYAIVEIEYSTDYFGFPEEMKNYDVIAICNTKDEAEQLIKEANQKEADDFLDWIDERRKYFKEEEIIMETIAYHTEFYERKIVMVPYYKTDAS